MKTQFWLALSTLSCLVFACGSKDGHGESSLARSDAGATPPTTAADGGEAIVPDAPDAGARLATEKGGKAASDRDAGRAETQKPDAGSMPSQPPPPSAAEGRVPCDVARVLRDHCVRCHGNTLREGAPFSLVKASDFQRDLGGYSVGTAVLGRVKDDARPMPPAPASRLSPDEIATLQSWIDAGAEAAMPGCVVDDSMPVDAGTHDGGVVVVVTRPPSHDDDAGGPPLPNDAGSMMMPDAGPPPSASEWPMFGFDLANSRDNVDETTLTAANVGKLRELWRFNGPSTTSAPALVGSVIYLPGWDGKVYAMRVDDGGAIWTASLPHLIDSSPTVSADRVFVADDHGSVHALDRASGNELWAHAVDSHPETHLWSSPMYIAGSNLLVQGVASGEEQVPKSSYTFRGSVVGLDADSGNERWRVATTSQGSGPGIGVWATGTIDEARKLVFIGTGNNYAPPASSLSDSLLAIDYESGQLAWSKQFTSGDTYTIYGAAGPDFDIGSTANLFSIDGSDYVGIGVKSGNYYALDRDSGVVRWMAALGGGSPLGGVISASAYANGIIFAVCNTFAASSSTLFAIDARNGQILWSAGLSNLTYGGVAHASGVVYVGSTAGTIYAFADATGEMLWSDQTPGGQPIAGSPTVAGGRLFVPWGYQWTLRQGSAGTGGLTVYGP
ncbi:MAG TPA: PQQ-binding-like beta-propeller repeat protein [Polyangiales bacterium]